MRKLNLRILLCVCALVFAGQALASPPALSRHDIRSTMQQMLSYHVEFKEFSPLVAKRSFKVFIEQFDPEKIYLLAEEIKPFLEMSEKTTQKVIEGYLKDDFSSYEALSRLVAGAIVRAREVRQEVQRELIMNFENVKGTLGESYQHYSANGDQLKERIRKKMVRFLYSEKKASKAWTVEKRSKICSFLEKRIRRFETTYLPSEKQEHYLALHVLKAMAKSLDAHTAFFRRTCRAPALRVA